jgi:hypothetical protein
LTRDACAVTGIGVPTEADPLRAVSCTLFTLALGHRVTTLDSVDAYQDRE